MIRTDRISAAKAYLPIVLLLAPWLLLYLGVPPLWPDRVDPIWPLIPLVSVPNGVAPDVWSSVPGLLRVALSAFQGIVLVELARIILITSRRMGLMLFLATAAYQFALALDWLRVWAGDWFVWILYRLHLAPLCEASASCLPVEGKKPWFSFVFLIFALLLLWRKVQERVICE